MNGKWFLKGMKNGIPIAMGYLAVAFALGITARNAGMTAAQATITSLTVTASAGQYAGFSVVAAGGTYMEMVFMMLVANIRYLLMSCSLSQKLSPDIKFIHRLGVAYGITDEIFGTASAVEGYLNPFYNYGMMIVAIPGWGLGTLLGVVVGNVLPENLVTALGVGLFGMFIAIIIPPAKKSKIVAALVAISMVASFACSRLPVISGVSGGMRTVILTVIIAGGAAVLFPVNEDQDQTVEKAKEVE